MRPVESLLDAVRIMLPLVRSFPLEGLTFNIAADPYLTARKTLKSRAEQPFTDKAKVCVRESVDPHALHKDFGRGVLQSVSGCPSCLLELEMEDMKTYCYRLTFAKNTSSLPSSRRACSQRPEMISSSAASA